MRVPHIAALFNSFSRLMSGLSNLLLTTCSYSFLDSEQLGFFFLILAIWSSQMFFEAGAANLCVQKIARASVHFNSCMTNIAYREYVLSIKFYRVWFLLAASVAFFLLSAYLWANSGYIVSNQIILPLGVAIIATSLSVYLSGILSILDGHGSHSSASAVRAVRPLILLVSTIILYREGLGLNAVALSMLVSVFFSLTISLFVLERVVRTDILKLQKIGCLVQPNMLAFVKGDYIRTFWSVFPFQWRLSLTWASAFVVYFAYVPVSFAVLGPSESSSIGLLIQVSLSLAAISSSGFSIYLRSFVKRSMLNPSQSILSSFLLRFSLFLAVYFLGCFSLPPLSRLPFDSISRVFVQILNLGFFPYVALAGGLQFCFTSFSFIPRCYGFEPVWKYVLFVASLLPFALPFLFKQYGTMGGVYFYLFSQLFLAFASILESRPYLWRSS
jgi:hypothetical protein